MQEITFRTPFDRHSHFREITTLLPHVLKYTAAQFWGSVVMPNLTNPVVKWQQANDYWREIQQILSEQNLQDFAPIMTAYLTDNTDPRNIEQGFETGMWHAAKLYPHGATTNSDKGVTKLEKIFKVLEKMEKIGMPLLIHPETDASRFEIPFMDRERVYTEESLTKIHEKFPALIISVEHITTREACMFVEQSSKSVVGTVTPQHILYNHDAIFHNGVPPYKPGVYVENMCLPILKHQEDVKYIRLAIMLGGAKKKFGAGTDTAPHNQTLKHSHGSCCGVFNSPHAVECYAMAFDQMERLDTPEGIETFENFMSVNNLWIYGLEPSKDKVALVKKDQIIPELVDGDLRPFKAGQTIPWTLEPR